MRLHIGRFLVATFAGICAVFGPRLISLLATTNPTEEIMLFGNSYLIVGTLVSIMIGFGIVVMKWNVAAATPSEIFGAALAFPAVIAGGLNMSASVTQLGESQDELVAANMTILEIAGLQQRESEAIHIIGESEAEPSESSSILFDFSLIGSAHAQSLQSQSTLTARPGGFDPGRILSQQQYFVFLNEFDNADDAIQASKELQSIAPDAVAVESGGKFYVLEDTNTRGLSQATIDALRLLDELPEGSSASVSPGIIRAPSQ